MNFNCCIKDKEPFKTPFTGPPFTGVLFLIYYFKNILGLAFSRDIHTECSKQFKWNLYLYVSGPILAERAVLGSAKTALKFKYEI